MAGEYVALWKKARQAFFDHNLLEMDVEMYCKLLLSVHSYVVLLCLGVSVDRNMLPFWQKWHYRLRLHVDNRTI